MSFSALFFFFFICCVDHALLEINDMSFSWKPNVDEPEKSNMLLKHGTSASNQRKLD